MNVLAIETSCDDTAAAVVRAPREVLAEVVYSQAVHARFGGVVPEWASRAHCEQIVPTVRAALHQAGVSRPDLVAVTSGPGLVGAILVGLSYAKGAAIGWGVPLMAVHHLEGHLLSALLEDPSPAFPFLSLVVSGGHTTLYAARGVGQYEVLCTTVDDAVGEAFDKVARMLGLGYPGGPGVERLAREGRDSIPFPMPRPTGRPHDVSFSGLKSAVRQHLERNPGASPADVAASFQSTVARYLASRVREAADRSGLDSIAIGGGAAANTAIREAMIATGLRTFLPPRARCTDNAAMIANVAIRRLEAGFSTSPFGVTAHTVPEVKG